uniref:E3 ubiquitin-protein ligase HERC2 n=1 Tax=Lygus hesperus TaxID=30085 RepID=A0A0K8TBS7_LYGHE
MARSSRGASTCWGRWGTGPSSTGILQDWSSSLKVLKSKAIGAKCSYSVAITTDNVVLHWGDIMSTECSCQNMPIELKFPDPISFRQLACATSHVCLLTSDSKVYLWGTSPEEGHLDGLHPVPPQLITTKEHKNITSIACSREVTVALTENGRVYVLLSPTSLEILMEAQKTLPVMEIAGSPFSDTPIVFRMGDEGFIRIFPP